MCIMTYMSSDLHILFTVYFDRQILPAISTSKLTPVLEQALQYDVIGIDEGQFVSDVIQFNLL